MKTEIEVIWLLGALGALCFGLLVLVLERIYPERLRRVLSLWGAASICLGVSYFIRLGRAWESSYVFNVVSCVLVATCLTGEWWAIRKLKQQSVSLLSVAGPPLFMLAYCSWFTVVEHNITKELLGFNFINMAIMIAAAASLLKKEGDHRPFPDIVLGCIFAGLAAITLGIILDYIHTGQYLPEYDFNNRRSNLNGIAAIVSSQLVFPLFLMMLSERLNRTLTEEAMRDPLTDLFNRRAFEEIGFREMSGAYRTGYCFSVLMFDVDHFKAVNDECGHAAGDKILSAVADTLRNHLRDEDYLCRWGGDEFCALLPRAESMQARMVAQRIIQALGELDVTHGGRTIAVSVSIGIATKAKDKETLPSLIERADDAMYLAKQAGRNRFVVSPTDCLTQVANQS
jgi:diguanylate cyclase (GGDEF)-like protein